MLINIIHFNFITLIRATKLKENHFLIFNFIVYCCLFVWNLENRGMWDENSDFEEVARISIAYGLICCLLKAENSVLRPCRRFSPLHDAFDQKKSIFTRTQQYLFVMISYKILYTVESNSVKPVTFCSL